MTDEPENFNDVLRRRPPPGRLGRRLLVGWGVVEVDDDDDQTGNDNQPNPAA